MAWTIRRAEEGGANAILDNVSGVALGSDERSPVASSKIDHGGARRARLLVKRRAAPQGA